MTLTIDELAVLDMCLMKEIGRHRMELLSDAYLMDDELFNKKEMFATRLEQLSEKIMSMKQELENEDLK